MPEKTFKEIVISSVGDALLDCYQCSKCSAGCPVSFAMDLLPHQVIRSVLFDRREKLLGCRTIWVCASCETCTTRCPNDIDIAGVMDVLRQIHQESGAEAPVPKVPVFHESFLGSIKKTGRVHELTMMRNFSLKSGDLRDKLKSGGWKNDIRLGLKMFLKGKLKLLAPQCRAVAGVRKIFDQAKEHKKT